MEIKKEACEVIKFLDSQANERIDVKTKESYGDRKKQYHRKSF